MPKLCIPDEEKKVCHLVTHIPQMTLLPPNRYSNITRLYRITSWMLRFIYNCLAKSSSATNVINLSPSLSVSELAAAENYWLSIVQKDHFSKELTSLKSGHELPKNSSLISYHLCLDMNGLIRVGGRIQNAKLSYQSVHPVVIMGKHQITKLIIHSEHLRLPHAGPTLLLLSPCVFTSSEDERQFVQSPEVVLYADAILLSQYLKSWVNYHKSVSLQDQCLIKLVLISQDLVWKC